MDDIPIRTPASPASTCARPGAVPSDALQVTSVTAHGWRVTDGRLGIHDPFRLLAFIEQRSDSFEVLQLGSGFEWHVFGSLDAAVAFVRETGQRLVEERRRDELAPIG